MSVGYHLEHWSVFDAIYMDADLLILINSFHTSFLDIFMWNISSKWMWIPLYVVLVYCLLRRLGWQGLWVVLAMAICVGLSDFISSGIIKHLVCRPRPTHNPELENILWIVNNYRGGEYGFVSSHAANSFSLSLLYCLIWQKPTNTANQCRHYLCWLLMLWCGLNCYSRMYLGVHYPGDILGGLIVGALVAIVIYWVMQWAMSKKLILATEVPHITDNQLCILNILPSIALFCTLIVACFPL